MLTSWRSGNTELAGYLKARIRKGLTFSGLFCLGDAEGSIDQRYFRYVDGRLIASLKAAPKLDGILLALHGAMVADGYPQADEEIVRRVRKAFGDAIPMIVTHDFHGNPSPEMVRLIDGAPRLSAESTSGYAPARTARGGNHGSYAERRGEAGPGDRKPPMVYNIIFQHTYAEPLLPITRAAWIWKRTTRKSWRLV